jgi:hypothetical protein
MKVLKKLLKYSIWLLGFFIILVIGLYIFIQTETFNKWALDFTLGKLNKSWELKDNKVSAESLNGNILKGIKLNNGAITVRGDTLIGFSYLEVKYDLWALLKHKISVDYLILNSPRIYLIGYKDKNENIVWNYLNLFTPSTTTDTTTSVFDWDVSVNTFKIENGNLRIMGNKQDNIPIWKLQREKEKEFDFNTLDVNNIELELEGKYYKDSKTLNLKNLSFNTNSDFNLKKMALVANINIKDTITDVQSLELITSRSNIKIDKIHMAGFNPLNGVDFYNKEFQAKINIERFNFADLKFFLPSLDMFDSTVALSLDAQGKFGNIKINNLTLTLPNSNINLKGNVKNLDNTDSLYFDITANDLKIYPGDVQTVYKNKSIPDYSNLGLVQGNVYYKGFVNNFYSEYDIKTGAGYINGVTSLDLNNEIYNGNITTHQLNIGKILKNNKLNSSLNLSAKFSGNGFNFNTMSANVNYSMNNSSIAGYNVSNSAGEIKAVHNNFVLNIKANTSAGNALISGRVNIANINNPVYAVKGKVNGLDIAKFTKNAGDKSNLNMAFDINGRGSNLSNINGKYDFVIDKSNYSNYQIPQTPLNIDINNSGNQSSIKVATDMADFNASGTFDIASISNSVIYNVSALNEIIKRKLNPDSVSAFTTVSKSRGGNVNLNYELVVKDTAKLTEAMRPFGIVFNGNVKGNIVNSSQGFNSTVLLNVKDFKYRDTSIILKNVNTDFSFKNDYSSNNNSFSPYSIGINTTAQKIIFGSSRIDSAKLLFNMVNSVAELKANGKQDSTRYGRIAGNFDLSSDKITANIDSLYAKYNLYEVTNNNKWLISYLPGTEVDFEQMSIKSKDATVNVSGVYSFTANSDVKIESNNLKLKDIFSAIKPVDTSIVKQKYKYPIDGELTKLFINFKGTIENPEIEADINTNLLKSDKVNVGTINAKLNYKDEVLTPDIVFQNYNNKGNLTISGNMPFENPLEKQDSSNEINNNSVALKLDANDFQIEYFSKIIPSLGEISGVLKGELTANGSASNPDLTGSLSMNDGNYFLPLTGMYYDFKFNVSTSNSMLLIDKFSLLNPNDDSKHFDLSGNMDFKGMKINNIDLTASGDVHVLDATVDDNQLGVTGDIYIGSGTPPITIKGNFDKLDIKGQLLIKEATIESVPIKGNGYDIGRDNFVYINATDSSFHKQDSLIAIGPKRFDKINPFEKYRYRLKRAETSVWDFLNLDLNVKTEKDLNIDISFMTLARSRLYGMVQADLNLKTENKVLNAYGNVDVVGNSYFRLYKDFKLKDSRITFNGPITNPMLDLRAVYSGTKTIEQYGTISNIPVQVAAYVQGNVDDPKITFKLIQDGDEVTGDNAGGDAVTFLLFGKFRSDLTESQQSAMASGLGQSVGSYYASSYLTDALREVLPFIVGAEFKYSEGDVITNSDVQVTSELGDATIKVGSHEVKNVNYFEFTIDYPISKLLNLNLPETLLLEIAKEELTYTTIITTDQQSRIGLKIIYKFRF